MLLKILLITKIELIFFKAFNIKLLVNLNLKIHFCNVFQIFKTPKHTLC